MEFDPVSIENAVGLVLQGFFVVGCTQVIKGFIRSPSLRDTIMPGVALVLGVVAVVGSKLATGQPVDFTDVMLGVALGGTATGLYAIRREKQAAVEVNEPKEVNVGQAVVNK